MAKKHPGFSLSELIKTTADELRAAHNDGDDAVLRFSGCELELAVTLGAEGETGIRFWLVNASAKLDARTVSTIKLTFDPIPSNPVQAPVVTRNDNGIGAGAESPEMEP